tara:strand:+ start:175 stop:861 length:687 start_codon:yes stop_codon:yes gene_type:complete
MFYYIKKFLYGFSLFTSKNPDCIALFIAVGTRNNTVENNVKYFEGCDCVVFKYTKKKLNIENCQEVYKKASWSKFLILSDSYIKKEHKYITIVLDDVRISNYFFPEIKNKIDKYNNSIVTPKIYGSYYDYNKIKFTEIFVTTFSNSSWRCWISMMNKLRINFKKSIGWGFDLCFPVFCPNVVHIKTNGSAFHKYSIRNTKFNRIGTNEVKKYNEISLFYNKRLCLTHT